MIETQFALPLSYKDRIRNLLTAQNVGELSEFLDIPEDKAREACQVWKNVEQEFFPEKEIDSEQRNTLNLRAERFKRALILSLCRPD